MLCCLCYCRLVRLDLPSGSVWWSCSAAQPDPPGFLENLLSALQIRTATGPASLVAQRVKHLPTMLETRVRSLGQEDPLEKEMATHSSTLPRKSHGLRSLVGPSPWGRKESDTTE